MSFISQQVRNIILAVGALIDSRNVSRATKMFHGNFFRNQKICKKILRSKIGFRSVRQKLVSVSLCLIDLRLRFTLMDLRFRFALMDLRFRYA